MKTKKPKTAHEIVSKRSQSEETNHEQENWNFRVRKDVSEENEANRRATPIIKPSTFMKYYLVH